MHERYMTAILSCEKIQEMEKGGDPLDAKDGDIIPDKYGKRWFEEEGKNN